MNEVSSVNKSVCFVPPIPSIAERNFKRSKSHFVGQMVLGKSNRRVVRYESRLEGNIALILSAQIDVVEILEQQRFIWVDSEKKRREHYFDFVVKMKDGGIIAVSVKPTAFADRQKFTSTIAEIAAQAVPIHFSSVRVMTEQDVCPIKLHNAKLFHAARGVDPEADCAALAVVQSLKAPTTLEDITQQIGLGGRGFFSLLCMIQTGTLRCAKPERIDYTTLVLPHGVLQ